MQESRQTQCSDVCKHKACSCKQQVTAKTPMCCRLCKTGFVSFIIWSVIMWPDSPPAYPSLLCGLFPLLAKERKYKGSAFFMAGFLALCADRKNALYSPYRPSAGKAKRPLLYIQSLIYNWSNPISCHLESVAANSPGSAGVKLELQVR